MGSRDSLNSSQALHLLTSCKYVDQILSDIESILYAWTSKSPFPKYRVDLSPVQVKIVQDYIARIRAQMVTVLKSQGISPAETLLDARHSIRVNLEFAQVAFDECRPMAMRGYGEVPESLIPELNGVVNEMSSMLHKLSSYLALDLGQDLRERLHRLEQTGDEIELLKTLEQVIKNRGLVEFRSSLSIILDKLEANNFQIATFGRVSSGKSSLLNHILQTDVLPVGVNPITAVPTRLVYGAVPTLTVSYLDKRTERMEVGRLTEFASEQFNPGNAKHVTRIVVELPASRLREGVVFVDTPGLGSLATSGAAETLAYLPQCDLGVVLIDAGSTLNQEDLSTLESLYEASIPAMVLLSKADLLKADDRVRSVEYISEHISTQLGLSIRVDPVSTRGDNADLLEDWFGREIQPLYARHQELARQSLRRKIGALRESVETALRFRLDLRKKGPQGDSNRWRLAEAEVRRAAGMFEPATSACLKLSDEIRDLGELGISRAAQGIVATWFNKDGKQPGTRDLVVRDLTGTAAEGSNQVFAKLQELARDLARALANAASALGVGDVPSEQELAAVVKELPRFDPGPLDAELQRDFFAVLGKRFAARRAERRLHEQIGSAADEAFRSYGRTLESWIRRTIADLQRHFDSHADGYRSQLEHLTGTGTATPEETEEIQRDLELLSEVGQH